MCVGGPEVLSRPAAGPDRHPLRCGRGGLPLRVRIPEKPQGKAEDRGGNRLPQPQLRQHAGKRGGDSRVNFPAIGAFFVDARRSFCDGCGDCNVCRSCVPLFRCMPCQSVLPLYLVPSIEVMMNA